jgi:hypothetical protein
MIRKGTGYRVSGTGEEKKKFNEKRKGRRGVPFRPFVFYS